MEETKTFFGFRDFCIEQVRVSQDLSRISWGMAEAWLQHNMDSSTVWSMPKEFFIPYKKYLDEHGNPETNGKGHAIGNNLDGLKCVIVPENTIQTRHREVKDTFSLKRRLDGNSDAGQLADKWHPGLLRLMWYTA